MLAHLKYGVTKSELHSAIINRFELNPDQINCLSIYYILRWKGDYFRAKLRSGTITREGKTYIVVYKDTKPTDIKVDSTVFLSFRVPCKEYELSNYVLVVVV